MKEIILFFLFLLLFHGCVNKNNELINKQKKTDSLSIKKDTAFTLEKIIFHSTECFGTCPVCDLEINNNKFVKLSSKVFKKHGKIDSTRTGNFFGTISDSALSKLNNLL